eukprot:Gb_17927 [translate_table: standard]
MSLMLFLILFSLPSVAHSHQNNVWDQHALLSFRDSVTHDPHNSLQNWMPNISFCSWSGVKCSKRRQRVVSLNITSMDLEGSISPLIGNMSFLQFLDLSNNSFHGNVPQELSRLFRLQVLSLSNNHLGSLIPPQLGRLSQLRVLAMENNKLEGHIPSTLTGCRNLHTLALTYNYLSGSIPAGLSLLANLGDLALGANNLTGTIPSSLGNLSALKGLDLGTNNLHGHIPVELGMLTRLERLYLFENDLAGSIPPSLGNLSALIDLELAINHLQDFIPVELGRLTQLEVLLIHENDLSGTIPSSLSNISTLTNLALYTNNLTGVIPPELGRLTNLELLFLYKTYVTGQIPTSISNCTRLQKLDLSENELTGYIPWEFGGKLTELQMLDLRSNQLSGSIPESIGNCSKLTALSLTKNSLSGTVPIELGKLLLLERLNLNVNQLVSGNSKTLPFLTALTNCSRLQTITLLDNNLSGVLPLSIGQLSPELSYLDLSNNYIGGDIPHQIGNLTNLGYLALYGNLFNGTIPSSIKRCQKLERLSLGGNRLKGNIPKDIGQMQSLGGLSLGRNMLSGQIPDSLGQLQQLRRLSLHHNQLTGNIPASLGKCQTLEMVDLSHNRLNGSIPPEVAGLSNLQFYFNLSGNSLQGRLPLEIGKMVMVIEIDISVNQLSSRIPDTVGSCIALQNLNLSQNALEGLIPVSVGNLQNLQEMDLSSNFLSGTIPNSLKRLKMLRYVDFSFNNLTGEVSKEALFSNQSIFASFKGNPDLCGPLVYSLPACPRKQRNHSLLKRVTGSVAGASALLFFCLLVGFIWKWNLQRRRLDISQNVARRPRISYQELCTATNGFNETNLLGVGSFGSVYRGILSDGTTVAVKALDLQNEEAHKSFNRELKALRKVRHRNLVGIMTSCSNLTFKGLVLQFMSNGSLEKHLHSSDGDDCQLELSKRLSIAKDIAHAMEYLHYDSSVQVVHCDLKPANVLLDDDMTAHVTDFGIARLTGSNSTNSLTSTIALKGSIGYIPPEYGLSGTVSTKGDVYSYGVMILEMLPRKRPTHEMFAGDLNLHKWVSSVFPNRVVDVVDSSLLIREVGGETMDPINDVNQNCVISLLQVGLLCTKESPQERPTMRDVVIMLKSLTASFVGRAGASYRLKPTIPTALLRSTGEIIRRKAAAASDTSSTL